MACGRRSALQRRAGSDAKNIIVPPVSPVCTGAPATGSRPHPTATSWRGPECIFQVSTETASGDLGLLVRVRNPIAARCPSMKNLGSTRAAPGISEVGRRAEVVACGSSRCRANGLRTPVCDAAPECVVLDRLGKTMRGRADHAPGARFTAPASGRRSAAVGGRRRSAAATDQP